MDGDARRRLERTLAESPETRFVAEGSFGLYSEDGQSSYDPPEGFGERFGVRVADFSQVTGLDIEEGRNLLRTPLAEVPVATPCGYAVLEPAGRCESWATLDGQTVGVRTEDGRFTWLGLTLSAGFAEEAPPELVLGLAAEAGVRPPVRVDGAEIVPVVRPSRQGGWLLFLLNMRGTRRRRRSGPNGSFWRWRTCSPAARCRSRRTGPASRSASTAGRWRSSTAGRWTSSEG